MTSVLFSLQMRIQNKRWLSSLNFCTNWISYQIDSFGSCLMLRSTVATAMLFELITWMEDYKDR